MTKLTGGLEDVAEEAETDLGEDQVSLVPVRRHTGVES